MKAESDKLDTLQAVELAEGIEILLRMAGPMQGASAYTLDLLILVAVGGIAIASPRRINLSRYAQNWFQKLSMSF